MVQNWYVFENSLINSLFPAKISNLSIIDLTFLIGITNPQFELLTKSAEPVFSVTMTGQPADAPCKIDVAKPSSMLGKT